MLLPQEVPVGGLDDEPTVGASYPNPLYNKNRSLTGRTTSSSKVDPYMGVEPSAGSMAQVASSLQEPGARKDSSAVTAGRSTGPTAFEY